MTCPEQVQDFESQNILTIILRHVLSKFKILNHKIFYKYVETCSEQVQDFESQNILTIMLRHVLSKFKILKIF